MEGFHKVHKKQFGNNQLYSVFQPIYSFSNQACIGVEALIRGNHATTGEPIPVYECLKEPDTISKTEFVRELNRLHLASWTRREGSEDWIFLNFDFHNITKLEDICLSSLIAEFGITGHKIVVEVVESEIKDEALFQGFIDAFRELGCLIALDDFGAGHSNVDRIWKAQPDIVKLDRQILLEATKSFRSESILRNLTRLIQQSGSIALLEGIETKEQALLAMDVGVDLVQGFYFAKPSASLDVIAEGEALVKEVTEFYPRFVSEKRLVKTIQKKGYEALFDNLQDLQQAHEIEEAMLKMASMSFVKRFFILDSGGYQISEEYSVREEDEPGQNLLKQGKGLCWKNRRYFIKAQLRPGDIYVSKPYRSLIDVELCLTISKMIQTSDGKEFIACFDVYYHDKSTSSVQISI